MKELKIFAFVLLTSCGVKIGNGNHDESEAPPSEKDKPAENSVPQSNPSADAAVPVTSLETFFHAALSNTCVNPLPTLSNGKRSIQFDRGPDRTPWIYQVTTSNNVATIFSQYTEFTSVVTKSESSLNSSVLSDEKLAEITCVEINSTMALLEVKQTREQRLIAYIIKDGELTEVQLINPYKTDLRDVGKVKTIESKR